MRVAAGWRGRKFFNGPHSAGLDGSFVGCDPLQYEIGIAHGGKVQSGLGGDRRQNAAEPGAPESRNALVGKVVADGELMVMLADDPPDG